MFPIEPYLKTLKGFVKQNSQPEGSMGEGYLVQKAMGVCHDIIGDMDKYAPRVWKEEKDERKTSLDYCFLTLHFLCLPLLDFIAFAAIVWTLYKLLFQH
jgi:hypothetical protein